MSHEKDENMARHKIIAISSMENELNNHALLRKIVLSPDDNLETFVPIIQTPFREHVS